jgi:hypothetical protein
VQPPASMLQPLHVGLVIIVANANCTLQLPAYW